MQQQTTATKNAMKSAQFLSLFVLLSLQALTVIKGQSTVDIDDVIDARTKWEALQAELGPLDYKYLVTDISEGNNGLAVPVIVIVEADNVTEVESVFFTDEDGPVAENFLTVNAMLDLMEEEIDAGFTVTSVFDRAYGFPLEYTVTNEDEEVVQSVIIDPMTIYSLAQRELDTHYAMWNESATLDYDFKMRLSCFCIPSATTPKRIMVRDGEIANITDIEMGVEVENLFYNTIEKQFEEIQGAIDERWFVVDAQYNETLGYPTRFFFDVHPGIADEERATEISDVVILGELLPDIDSGIEFTDAETDPTTTGRPTMAPSAAATEGATPGTTDAEGTQQTNDLTSHAGTKNMILAAAMSLVPMLLQCVM